MKYVGEGPVEVYYNCYGRRDPLVLEAATVAVGTLRQRVWRVGAVLVTGARCTCRRRGRTAACGYVSSGPARRSWHGWRAGRLRRRLLQRPCEGGSRGLAVQAAAGAEGPRRGAATAVRAAGRADLRSCPPARYDPSRREQGPNHTIAAGSLASGLSHN
jgi:hypothetical protein